MTALIQQLAERPVVAVLRSQHAERFHDVCSVLLENGIPAVEITLTTAGALDAITAARRNAPPNALIGAGTVRTVEAALQAIDAGAQFLVSQVCDPRVVEAARQRGIPFIPGALTPTEIVSAWSHGVEAVKVSPVGPVGGIAYISELVGPLPEIPLFPTGGVLIEQAATYLTAGASLIGLSRDLVRDALDAEGDLRGLAKRSAYAVDLIDNRRILPALTQEERTL